jgi:hypothetical protein
MKTLPLDDLGVMGPKETVKVLLYTGFSLLIPF